MEFITIYFDFVRHLPLDEDDSCGSDDFGLSVDYQSSIERYVDTN